jgi:hypothetical protein
VGSVLAPESFPIVNRFPLGWFTDGERSPELRQTRVFLPERFASPLAPSALHHVVSPLVLIRCIYNFQENGQTNEGKNRKITFNFLTLYYH